LVDDEKVVGGQLLLEEQQGLIAAGFDRFTDQSGGGEAHAMAALAGGADAASWPYPAAATGARCGRAGDGARRRSDGVQPQGIFDGAGHFGQREGLQQPQQLDVLAGGMLRQARFEQAAQTCATVSRTELKLLPRDV
jgi:hypothetical protein